MSKISALPADLVQWLSKQSALSHITFLTEFPAVKKAIPLKKCIVAVGLESVQLEDKFVDNGNGILIKQEYCRSAALRITLAVHVPFSRGGHTCHEVFSNVVDALTFASDLNIEHSGCGCITADRDTDALVLKGYLDIASDFCPAASSGMHFHSFLNKELLCGTHIRDTNIHVSQEEKDKWNTPFVVSSYSGNGTASRSVNLGYKPFYVAIFAKEYPPSEYHSSTGTNRIYAGYAVRNGGTCGLQITDKGFTVVNNSNEYGTTVPFLNMSGTIYNFFAMK